MQTGQKQCCSKWSSLTSVLISPRNWDSQILMPYYRSWTPRIWENTQVHKPTSTELEFQSVCRGGIVSEYEEQDQREAVMSSYWI